MTTVPPPALRDRSYVAPTPEDAADRLARWLADIAELTIAQRGRFTVALSGGKSARYLYGVLAAEPFKNRIAWNRWHFFFGDERACAPDDAASNFNLARTELFEKVGVRMDQVYRMRGEAEDLDAAAAEYARILELVLGRPPALDCVLLGLGENGHTASLFPGTDALESQAWCTRGRADYAPFDRLTLTYPTLNCSHQIAFLVTGESKGPALRDTIAGLTPASHVRPAAGTLHWFLDQAAAGAIPREPAAEPASD